MKFGKRLNAQRYKDWQQYYLNYELLKKHIKFAKANPNFDDDGKIFFYTSKGGIADMEIPGQLFQYLLEREFDKVNAFYRAMEKKLVNEFHALEKELPKLISSKDMQDTNIFSEQFSKENIAAFVKFSKVLEAFRYYVVLNYIAVHKIVKKRNKHLQGEKIDFQRLLLEQYFYGSQKAAKISVQCELYALQILPDVPIEEYRQNFTCPVCLQILCNPCLLSCGHRFCWSCLSQASMKIQACPVCKKTQVIDPNNLFVDWILNKFIQQHFPESRHRQLTHSHSSGADDGTESEEEETENHHTDDEDDIYNKRQKEHALLQTLAAPEKRRDLIAHLERLVKNIDGTTADFYIAPIPLTAFAILVKKLKNFVFTGLLTFLPVYWFLIVLFISMYSLVWALAICLVLLSYPHLGWEKTLHADSLRLRTTKLLHTLIGAMFDYFPMKLYRTTNLSPDRQYLFGYHPHGVFCFGVFPVIIPSVSGWEQLFPGVHCVMGVANSLLLIPILCTLFRRIGFIPVTKDAMNSAIGRQLSVMLVPGGIAEMLEIGDENTETIYLKRRTGFIKYALSQGLDLVPVYGFGENQTYDRYDWFKSVRLMISRKLRITLQPFSGRWFTLVPFSRPIHVVVGKPIPVSQVTNPTDSQVEKLLSRYKYALLQLFEQYKHQIPGYAHKKLIIL